MFNFTVNESSWPEDVNSPGVEKGWSVSSTPWNQSVSVTGNFNEDLYYVIVFDANENEEKLYINGDLENNVKISHKYWELAESVYEKNKDNYDGICFGIGSMTSPDFFHYANLECYSCRLYSRPLTNDEVVESYKKTLSYHDFLEKN